MSGKLLSWVLGGGAALLSLGGTAWSTGMQVQYARLLAGTPGPMVPIDPALVPPGTALPPRPAMLTPAQRVALAATLWRNPLDQKLGNLVYLDKVLAGRPKAETDRQAGLLAATGWRYNAAQYNLLMHAAQRDDFAGILDRAEGLLRRQRLAAPAIMMLHTMEAYPGTRAMVVAKLLERPRWRATYLTAIRPESGAALIDARVATMRTLLQRRQNVSRAEIASLLHALDATGQRMQAYRLWQLYGGKADDAELVHDGRFVEAARLAAISAEKFPFDWTFGQDIGFATQLGGEGATIIWDGRGVPTFLSQRVPVAAGGTYVLRIDGRAEKGTLGRLLAPTILCGTTAVGLRPVRDDAEGTLFRSDPLPAGCATGVLQIGGNVDSGRGNHSIELRRLSLRAVR